MRRLILIPMAMLALNVAVAKSSYTIVTTGQTKFYNNQNEIPKPKKGEPFYGQDAQFEGNAESYTDNGDGTITDNVTGLMWQKGFQVVGFEEALRIARDTTIAGYSDWRVPTIKEGYSLIMFYGVDASTPTMTTTPEGAIPFIDTKYFDFIYSANGSRPIDTQMISSTVFVGSSAQQPLIFGVNLADGRIKSYPKMTRGAEKTHTVRLVRGAAYGENNFKDNKNGTISDKATGLMWQKSDSQKGLNWEEALAYAAEMNEKKYLGHNDWRVPDVKELQSIVDYTRSPETTSSAAIDPIFDISEIKNEAGVVDYPFFWSSTTHCSVAAGGANGTRRNNMQGGESGQTGQNRQSGQAGQNRQSGQQSGQNQNRQSGGNMPNLSGGASTADYISFGRALGNMSNASMMGQQTNMTNNTARQGQGQRQGQMMQQRDSAQMMQRRDSMQMMRRDSTQQGQGQMMRQQGQMRQNQGSTAAPNWVNIHGAGSQRSDPKSGDPTIYAGGRGPQGDAIRIYNYVRLVRDL